MGFPVALVAFIGAVTLLSLGVGTAIIWIGLPILVAAGLYARGFTTVERRLQSQILGRNAPAPAYHTGTLNMDLARARRMAGTDPGNAQRILAAGACRPRARRGGHGDGRSIHGAGHHRHRCPPGCRPISRARPTT